MSDALIATMATNPVIAPYFDLSLQHASATLLRAMRRPGDGERHLQLISRIRDAAPDAALRSSFIVGFPGETDEDVETLTEFLGEARLDWAGFFPYSAEEGTPAADLPGRIDAAEMEERVRHVSSIQDAITAASNAAVVGTEFEVVIDTVEEGRPVARSHREAPEIDGVIVLDRGEPGEWHQVRITASYGNELAGEVVR